MLLFCFYVVVFFKLTALSGVSWVIKPILILSHSLGLNQQGL